MTKEVEQRIVEMRFDNEQFEKGAKQTLSTLEKLDGMLDILGAQGLDHLGNVLAEMEYRFSRVGTVGTAVIQNLTNRAINLGAALLRAIPEQIISGGTQRALNVENARFQLKGLGIAWEEVADDIDYAVMGTAYGADEAAKAAAIIGASGVQYKNAVGEISDMGRVLRSISGIAAMTNSSYDDIANVMGDIFAMGKVTNGELQRFELRGLNVVAKLAEMSQNGTLRRVGVDAKYTEKQLRELIAKGGMDALTFAKAMDLAFGEHATEANETYTGALRNMRAALSRIGEKFITPYHEGVRKVALALRELFNNSKAILTPFAEGTFTKSVEFLSDKIVKLIQSVDLKWLKSIVDMLDKIDLEKIFKSFEGRGGRVLSRLKILRSRLNSVFRSLKRIADVIAIGLGIVGKNVGKLSSEFGNRLLGVINKLFRAISRFNSSSLKRALYEDVAPRIVKITKLLRSLGNTAWTAGEVIFAIAKKVFNSLKDSTAFTTFGKAFDWIVEKITLASDKLNEWLLEVKKFIEQGTSAESILGKIQNGFKSVGEFIDEARIKVSNFLKELIGLKEGQTLFERFSEVVGELKDGPLKSFGESIKATFGSDDSLGTKVTKLFAALIAGFMAFRKFKTVQWAVERIGRVFDLLLGQWDGLETLANLPDKISTVFSRLSGSLRALTDNLNAKSIGEIAKAVVMLAVGIGILSLIDTDRAVVALEAMITSLTALMTALGVMTKFMTITMSLGIVAPILVALAASLLILSVAIGILSLIPIDRLGAAVFTMGVALFGLIYAIQQLDIILKEANPIKIIAAAIAIGLLSAAMLILAIAMRGFSLIPVDKMFAAWLAMAGALAIVVAAVYGLSKMVNPAAMLAGATALIEIGAALILIGAAVHLFRGIDVSELLPMAIALITVATALGLLAKYVDPLGMLAAGAALVLVGGALIVLAMGLANLSFVMSQDEDALFNLAGLLLIVGVALAALSSVAPMALVAALALAVAGVAFTIGAVGLLVLSAALTVFNDVKVNPDYLLAIGGALIALGVAGVIFGLGGVGLLLGGSGLLVLAVALNMMSGVNVAPDYLLAMGGALMALGIAGVIFGAGGFGLLIGGLGLVSLARGLQAMSELKFNNLNPDYFVSLGGGLIALGVAGLFLAAGSVGLYTGGEALTAFSVCLAPMAEGIKAFKDVDFRDIGALFVALAAALPALMGLNFTAFSNTKSLADLGNALGPLAGGIKAFSEVGFWDLAKLFGGLASALGALLGLNFANANGFSVMTRGMYLLATSIAKLPDDAEDKLKALAQAIRDNQKNPIDAMNEMLDGIVKSIDDHETLAANAFRNMLVAINNSARASQIQSNWRTIGSNIPVGIANGIYQNYNVPVNAMAKLAKSLQTTFTSVLKIHSPSRVFEMLTSYIPMAIANELIAGRTKVSSAMVECMSGAMSTMEQYSRTAAELTPMITPVMDVSSMRRDIQYSDRMFAGSRLGSFNGLNNMNVNGDSISYNMQNQDVVNAIVQLEYKIGQLGQTIQDMQLVMDTGVVVGALTPAINIELGKTAVRERRQ